MAAPALAALIMPAFGCDYLGSFGEFVWEEMGFGISMWGRRSDFFSATKKGINCEASEIFESRIADVTGWGVELNV